MFVYRNDSNDFYVTKVKAILLKVHINEYVKQRKVFEYILISIIKVNQKLKKFNSFLNFRNGMSEQKD